jgi:hypothetical protein
MAQYQHEHWDWQLPRRSDGESMMYQSKHRTILSNNPKAQQRLCTVAGVEQPHQARWSLKVRETTGSEVWVAACGTYVPPAEAETGRTVVARGWPLQWQPLSPWKALTGSAQSGLLNEVLD